MLPSKEPKSRNSNLFDDSGSYGWVSIGLHWLTTIALFLLWYFGKSVSFSGAFEAAAQRSLHVSFAATLWLIIMVRIIRRFIQGHPKILGQTSRTHRIACLVHYTLLLAVLVMLISGPTSVWASGQSIQFFDWFSLPSPFAESTIIAVTARTVHATTALIVLSLVLLHIAGALKHLMFNNDETFIRMITPRRNSSAKPSDNNTSNASSA